MEPDPQVVVTEREVENCLNDDAQHALTVQDDDMPSRTLAIHQELFALALGRR